MAYTRTFRDEVQYPLHIARNGVTLNSGVTTCVTTGQRSGQNMPGWKEIIRAGGNASTPYSLENTKLLNREEGNARVYGLGPPAPPGVTTWSRGTVTETLKGYAIAESQGIQHLTTSSAQAEAMALSKLYRKIEQEQNHLKGASFLAEGVDVLRQFGKPFDALVDLTNRRLNRLELEKRGLKGTISFRKQKWASIIASTYLEYAFGLEPLISDTRKAAEAYARWQHEALETPKLRAKAVGRGISSASTASTSIIRPGNSSYMRFSVSDRRVTEHRVQYTVGLKATPNASYGSMERLQALLGFQPRHWVPALWEAVPWSFLVDYCSNVQQILEAASADVSGVTWISKTVTTRTVRDFQSTMDKTFSHTQLTGGGFPFDQIVEGKHCGKLSRIRTTMVRSIPTSLSVPPLYVEFDLGLKQKANMVALLFARKPSSSAMWLY